MPLQNFEWNEAIDFEPNDPRIAALIVLVAIGPDRRPQPIGSGFVIHANGKNAVAMTAAHNIAGIHDVQAPRPSHHASTALPEFLPPRVPLSLDVKDVFAVCIEAGGSIEVAEICACAADDQADVATLFLRSRNPDSKFFRSHYEVDDALPEIGAEVCIVGFSDLQIIDPQENGTFQIGHRVLFRIGKVAEHYLDGHIFCRGPCVETSIPVFGGVSGGIVIRHTPGAKMRVFGLVCSDPEDTLENKLNRAVSGRTIAALLGVKIRGEKDGRQLFDLTINNGQITKNPEWDGII